MRLPNQVMIALSHRGGRCIYASVNGFRIGPDNGLSPDRRQAIIRANADLVSVRPTEKNWVFFFIKIQQFCKKMNLNMSSAIWRPFC